MTMNLPARNLTLLLFGLSITIATATGRYLNYVRPSMFWLLMLSGLVIVALALTGIAADGRAWDEESDDELDQGLRDDAEGGSGHGHHHVHRAAWLLLVPVLLLLFCAPPALGPQDTQSAVMNAAQLQPSESSAFPPLPAGDAPTISLHDFQNRAVEDTAGTLDRDVTVTAYVGRLNSRLVLSRMMIWCCVADARPIHIELEGTPELPAEGSWVTAVVRLVPGTATRDRKYTPLARLVSAHQVPQPTPAYDT